MKQTNCKCDRNVVCGLLGECFLEMSEIVELPKYLGEQIKNARSVKQALSILKITNHEQNKREKIRRQRIRDNIRNDRQVQRHKRIAELENDS